ncbi:MAG: NAD-dependent DNA ligase LigA [Patescibacteria group bacterium]
MLEEAKNRLKILRKEIEAHARAYYEKDAPSVSDGVYDSLVQELKQLEKKYPELADPNFIVYRVGGKPLEYFEKKEHKTRMLSLGDAFSFAEVQDWQKRIQKLAPSAVFEYFCELKMDGLACSLIYQDGVLKSAVTRGDGAIGEDITQNVKTISAVPIVLKGSYKGELEVRGEIVMAKSTLVRLNKKYQKDGKPLLANTRNAAAGSVRQLDSKLTAERSLDFFAWDIAQCDWKDFEKHSEEHKYLQDLGFQVAPFEGVCGDLEEVEKVVSYIEKEREKLDYGTDGVVIQVNQLAIHNTLGIVGKAPRYAIAYKYPAEQATTVVTNISVQVGRTGILTPLAHFVPTKVAGSLVSKSTLHNIDQIRRLDVRVGDTVIIQKAGDVIPEVVEVLKNLRPSKTKVFEMPEVCPECGGKVVQRKGVSGEESVGYYCGNPDCPAKQTKNIIHFVRTMEIYEVGPKIVERLQDEGLISDAADLFTLEESDLADLERFGAKSAGNIIREIQSKKNPPLDRFINALGIVHVGEQTARDLALHFKTFDAFWNASKEDLDSIENIGPAVVESIISYTKSKYGNHFTKKLFNAGVKPVSLKIKKGGAFEGKTFVLTGTLSISREEAKKLIQNNGGKVSSSVSVKTDYVLVGDNPGSKKDEAEKLKVKMLTEADFLKMAK